MVGGGVVGWGVVKEREPVQKHRFSNIISTCQFHIHFALNTLLNLRRWNLTNAVQFFSFNISLEIWI